MCFFIRDSILYNYRFIYSTGNTYIISKVFQQKGDTYLITFKSLKLAKNLKGGKSIRDTRNKPFSHEDYRLTERVNYSLHKGKSFTVVDPHLDLLLLQVNSDPSSTVWTWVQSLWTPITFRWKRVQGTVWLINTKKPPFGVHRQRFSGVN